MEMVMTEGVLRAEPVGTSDGTRYWLDETCWAHVRDDAGPDSGAAVRDERRRALLELFSEHGLAVPHRARPVLAGLRLAVVGSGTLARHLAVALLQAGACRMAFLDPSPPDITVWPGNRHATGAQAMAASLRTRIGVSLSWVPDVETLTADGPDLVLVTPATLEPDRLLLEQLVAAGLSHLVLTSHRDVARLGPLVLPGNSPCMGCHDLALTAVDPLWPQVLTRLEQSKAHPTATTTRAVVARAALEVGWLARDLAHARRLTGSIQMVDAHDPAPREARFGRDPRCGCTGAQR